jgi:hypothetical protein
MFLCCSGVSLDNLHVHHAQPGAAGGLELIASAQRAGIQTGCDGHTLAAGRAPGVAGWLINFDAGPRQ